MGSRQTVNQQPNADTQKSLDMSLAIVLTTSQNKVGFHCIFQMPDGLLVLTTSQNEVDFHRQCGHAAN